MSAHRLELARRLVARTDSHRTVIVLLIGTLASMIHTLPTSPRLAYSIIKRTCLAVANIAAVGERNTKENDNGEEI